MDAAKGLCTSVLLSWIVYIYFAGLFRLWFVCQHGMERQHAKSCWRKFFLKSRPLGRKKSRRDKLGKSKRAKIGVHSFASSFADSFACHQSLGSVNLLAAVSRFLIQFWSEIEESAWLLSRWQYNISSQQYRDRTNLSTGRVTPFSLGTQGISTTHLGTPWRSLSQCQARCTCHIQQSNIQSNLPTQTVELIGEERHFFMGRCIGFGAALWRHRHGEQL